MHRFLFEILRYVTKFKKKVQMDIFLHSFFTNISSCFKMLRETIFLKLNNPNYMEQNITFYHIKIRKKNFLSLNYILISVKIRAVFLVLLAIMLLKKFYRFIQASFILFLQKTFLVYQQRNVQ